MVIVDDLGSPQLTDDDRRHLARSLRLRDGEPIVLADGRGSWRTARYRDTDPEPDGEVVSAPRPDPPLGVAFALVKGAKPELVVQKLTELGIDRIVPFRAARSVVRWDEAKAAQANRRLAKVAREAAQQSRRARLPEVAEVTTFDAVVDLDGACLADRGGGALSLDRPLVLVGPEGGWTPEERVRAADLPTVALSDAVLRAETAAITAAALLAAQRLA